MSAQKTINEAANHDLCILTGRAHPALAKAICRCAGLGLDKLKTAEVTTFADGETKVRIMESVRGQDVFIIQPTCPPVNQNLMELLVMIDAAKRASASRVTAVIPYFGYARQDRKHESRVPITAKLVANLLATAGADRILTMDLHATQIQGFFDIPVDHLYSWPVLLDHVRELGLQDLTILSPDPGRLKLADSFAKRLQPQAQIALIHKKRKDDQTVERGVVVGDISGRNVLILDDMITTGGSVKQAVDTAREFGAKDICVMVTHPVFCAPAFEKLKNLAVSELVVTDTIPLTKGPDGVKLTVLSVADLLAKAIRRTHGDESISELFN